MPANAPMSAQELLAISAGFTSLGDAARAILSDDSLDLTVDQSDLVASDMTSLYDYAANVATQAAKLAFADSDAAFNAISTATSAGAHALQSLQSQVNEVDRICKILAAGVNLGVAIGSGNVASILSGAGALHAAAA